MNAQHRHGPADEAEEAGELPKITSAHLRRATTMCARRLAYEYDDRRSMRRGTGRFRVQNRLLEDARLTHVDLGVPDPAHFHAGPGLTEEETRLYDTAARWYVALYHDEPVRSVDLGAEERGDGVDDWATRDDSLGLRLVGRCGLTLQHPDGRRGVRLLRLGRGVPGGDMLDDVDVRFAVLRLSPWAAGELHLSVADLVHGARRDQSIECAAGTMLRGWLAERVEIVRARMAQAEAVPGLDCASCAFIPGCPAHR